MDGQVITQSAVPEVVAAELTAALPAPTSGVAFSVSTEVTSSVDLSVAFTQTFTSRVLETHRESVINIIQQQYTAGI